MVNPAPSLQYGEDQGFRFAKPMKKPTAAERRKLAGVSGTSSSQKETQDSMDRERKSFPYRTNNYAVLLKRKGSYMEKSDLDITEDSKSLIRRLLQADPAVPSDSLFRDDRFETTMRKLENRNEARVIQDIGRLIVPSAETLATYGATALDGLIEGVNESWNNSIAFEGSVPKPDYSTGFDQSIYTHEQFQKLLSLVGDVNENSCYGATASMFFPFFTAEVKCGEAALEVADRQNAHSMTVAVRGLVELYRGVGRAQELHREILAFSISHDNCAVRIYGHYPIIDGPMTTYYRHPIHKFLFTAMDGRDKWLAYKFTHSVYELHAPRVHQWVCSVLDSLPILNFALSTGSLSSFQSPAPLLSQESIGGGGSVGAISTNFSGVLISSAATPSTSMTPTTPTTRTGTPTKRQTSMAEPEPEQKPVKKPKK